MSLIDDATAIGNVLTQIDTALQSGSLSDADWQTLYSLRKHLDDMQRDLIAASINQADASYQNLTTQLNNASTQLAAVITDATKIQNAISIISQIASYADQIVKLAA